MVSTECGHSGLKCTPRRAPASRYIVAFLMNRHGEKEPLTSVPILCRITLQNAPYKDYKLFVLMSFEVSTVTSIDSQEPACCDDGTCWLLNEVGVNMLLSL